MNNLDPLKINNINLDNITYTKCRNLNSKKIIFIKYNDNNNVKNFVFQTPTLLNICKPITNNNLSELEISLEGKNNNNISNFVLFLENLENKIKLDATQNAYNWFNLDNNTINFQKIIRENNVIKLKLLKNNEFETLLQLNNEKKININNIPEDSWCKILLECYAIWINNNNEFGIFLRPIIISFTLKEKSIYKYNFIEESDSENDNNIIPDTDVNNNLFMKINTNKSNNNLSTSILEINELYNNLNNKSSTSSTHSKLRNSENINKDNENNENGFNLTLDIDNYTTSSDDDNKSNNSS